MKSSLPKLDLSFIVIAALFCILTLQGCAMSSNPREDARSTLPCTLVGCSDQLFINLTGDIPAEYTITVKDPLGNISAIQCFEDKRTITTYEYGLKVFPLNAPEVEKVSKTLPINDLCNTQDGYFGIKTWKDGFVESVTVQCFASDSRELLNSSCENNGATFVSFSPSEVTVSVYWDDKIKTEMIKPVYTTYRPNGAGCEPECKSGSLSIELP